MICCNQKRMQVCPAAPIFSEEHLIEHHAYVRFAFQFPINRMYWNSIMILQLSVRQAHASFSRRLQPMLKEAFVKDSFSFLAIHHARK